MNITIDPTFQNLMVVATSLIPLILFIIIIYRTRSGYILLKFLWDKVLRGKGSQYESIKTFDSEQYEVHRFIYHYGIKVRNLTEIEATLRWMENKDVAMHELRRIKDRFTPKDQKIRLASAMEFAILAVSIVLFTSLPLPQRNSQSPMKPGMSSNRPRTVFCWAKTMRKTQICLFRLYQTKNGN